MTPGLRLQGRVFCLLALALVIASVAGVRLTPLHEVLATAALISLLGMPHGALDVVFARQLFGVSDLKGWALFSLLYIGLAACVVGVWFLAPTLFLCAFLVLSALHFGGDPAAGVSTLARVLYGGAVIVLPALWHGVELQRLLGLVAGADSAAVVAPVLSQMAAPWLAASVLACVVQAKTSRLAAVEWVALAVLALAAPPLVAFTAYFCAMHSPRHILRTLANLPRFEAPSAVALAMWATLAVFAVQAVIGWWSSHAPIRVLPVQAWVMQLVFVGLAALTLPHMVLLEKARREGLPAHR